MHHHPWRALRALSEWTLHWRDLGEETLGVTDFDERTITLNTGMTQAQRRSTIAHETAHVERGPAPHWMKPREESLVDQIAARRLISFEALARAVVWAHTVEELAEELWVDEETALCRLRHMHSSERIRIAALIRARDGHEEHQ